VSFDLAVDLGVRISPCAFALCSFPISVFLCAGAGLDYHKASMMQLYHELIPLVAIK